MNSELQPLNVPLIHRIFKDQPTNDDGEYRFHRHPGPFGVGSQVVPAIVTVKNTTVEFQRLAKSHVYDPDEIYAGDGLPNIYSTI